jgi:hypothetical protein
MVRIVVLCQLLITASYGLFRLELPRTVTSAWSMERLDATIKSKSSTVPQDIAHTECDEDYYPWRFTGRLWFRPALVRTTSVPNVTRDLSVFGWTLGGMVALEYDESPVGPYREYVAMGALVVKRGAIGSWGKRLYVSCPEAERLCQEVWGVPAEQADIDFHEQGSSLQVTVSPFINENSVKSPKIQVNGWSNTRIAASNVTKANRIGQLLVLWTPLIKALWIPFVHLTPLSNDAATQQQLLPLHRLRLSASSVRPCLCGQDPSGSLGIPFGIGLVVDNILIEISPQIGEL